MRILQLHILILQSRSNRLEHTARSFQAMGFDANSSMYHVGRQDNWDESYRKEAKEKKVKKSLLKKLASGSKEKPEKL